MGIGTDEIKNDSKGIANYWFFIAMPITIGSFFYLFKERTLDEILRYTFYITVPLSILLLSLIIIFGIKEGFKKKHYVILIVLPLLIIIWAMSYYAIAVSIIDIYKWIITPSFSINTIIFLTITTTLILGIVLFFIRLNFKALYGISELILGLFIAYNKISKEILIENFDLIFFVTYLTASVYLVVRGLDNIHQGLTKDPIDPLANKLYKFLKDN